MKNETLLVTGATGLLGSVVCRMAVERGYKVRALLRDKKDAEILEKLGVRHAIGDITDLDSLERAAQGVDAIVHAAAVVGGTWTPFSPQEFHDANYVGAVNAYQAGAKSGVRRIVAVNTVAILDNSVTATERSPITPIKTTDSPYTRAKRAAYFEGMRRASLGQDIVFVLPAGIYGPGLYLDRAFAPTCFNSTILNGMTGELKRYADFPFGWVYVDDVALVCLRSLESGENGTRYLASGPGVAARSVAKLCNLVNEMAGVDLRVENLSVAELAAEIGSVKHLADRVYANPIYDPSWTEKALGTPMTSLEAGVRKTLAWFKQIGKWPAQKPA